MNNMRRYFERINGRMKSSYMVMMRRWIVPNCESIVPNLLL
jgi:hypothetical protein